MKNAILDVLAAIRPRPGMFIGSEDVRTLDAFLNGVCAALRYCDRDNTNEYDLLYDFSRWLHAKYGDDSTRPWTELIETRFQNHPELWPSKSGHEESPNAGTTRLFFVEMDEFLATRGTCLPTDPEIASRFFGGRFR